MGHDVFGLQITMNDIHTVHSCQSHNNLFNDFNRLLLWYSAPFEDLIG